MKRICLLLLIPVLALFNSCSVKLNGASIPPEMKTITVLFFENNAPLVVASLSQDFTEALKLRIRNQTRLSISSSDADAIFEGRITGYDIRPAALQSSELSTAATNRLSIRVNVKYTNNLLPKQSFEESFERYKDFLATQNLASIQQELINDINNQLTEDIFNRAFAQW